ncbi:MAG: flagellar filament capping protein FliD [Pseudomonadota bacterium]|jgi:flagellar hook-associated protein 2
MAAISSLGVGSGINAEAIVTQLMTVEKQSLTALKTKQSAVETKISAYGSLSSLLDTLSSKLSTMKSTNTLAAYKPTSSNTSVLTATASSTAGAGTYNIAVTQLATAEKKQAVIPSTTGVSTVIGNGDIGISIDGGTNSIISMSSATATLGDWRDAINSANVGATASIINTGTNSILTLTANDTGKPIAFNLTGGTNGGTNGTTSYGAAPAALSAFGDTTPPQLAQSATYTIDGQAITSKSNSDSTTIPGVTVNLLQADPLGTKTSTLTVARDTSTTTTAVTDFVTAYNALNTKIKSLTAYDATNKVGSTLTGDSAVRNLQSQLSSTIGASYGSSVGTYSRLADLGISFQKDGSMALDSAKLTTAISKDSTSAMSVLTSASTALYAKTSAMTTTGGMMPSKTDSLKLMVKDYISRQDTMQLRLTAIEKRYRAQFSSLDTIVSGMSTTSTYLTQALAKL